MDVGTRGRDGPGIETYFCLSEYFTWLRTFSIKALGYFLFSKWFLNFLDGLLEFSLI